jgi:predicted PurR-regulated permease PerM
LEIAAVTVFIAALYAASGLLIPIAVTFFLAVLSYPVMRWLNRRMPLALALSITFAAIGYAAINFVCDSLSQRVLLVRSFGLSIFAIILNTLFWGWFWGPFGLFLALPITLVLKDLFHASSRRWLATAMEGQSLG